MPKHLRYTPECVKKEAEMYLSGDSILTIARKLKMPNQTVSWHLIHPLKRIDYSAWIAIRYKLLSRAHDPERQSLEEQEILNSGISTELLYHQWSAVQEERNNEKGEKKK